MPDAKEVIEKYKWLDGLLSDVSIHAPAWGATIQHGKLPARAIMGALATG
jgi:hypothetical protein